MDGVDPRVVVDGVGLRAVRRRGLRAGGAAPLRAAGTVLRRGVRRRGVTVLRRAAVATVLRPGVRRQGATVPRRAVALVALRGAVLVALPAVALAGLRAGSLRLRAAAWFRAAGGG
ncbi:MAG: hypothetical protein MUF64_33215 [Polyangiaceae bacterium]|nr:hypothetical protein [Polyangiaceae bacterium]